MKKYKLKLDYTEEELKELKRLGGACDSPMTAVWRVVEAQACNDVFRNLRAKYNAIEHEDEFNFMADINNVIMGTAIFPEKRYVVHDKFTDQYVCFMTIAEIFCWSPLRIPEIKTKDEWLAINPAYETMLERVED